MKRIATLVLLNALMGLPVAVYGQTAKTDDTRTAVQSGVAARAAGDSPTRGDAPTAGDPFTDLVPVPYSRSRLAHLGAILPSSDLAVDLVWARQVPGGTSTLYFVGELRIVNWNASGHDHNRHRPASVPFPAVSIVRGIADDILAEVDYFDANVIILQELREDVYLALRDGLLARDRRDGHFDHRAWTCEAHVFGALTDLRVTCVKGPLANLQVRRLVNAGALNYESYKNREFWGYMQVDYYGVTITNVHVRNHWDEAHVCQLHHEVRTGVVAGDFNYPTPEHSPDGLHPWFQTDVNGPPTWQQEKIDHVLTVEPHVNAHAELAGKYGSNHHMLLTRFRVLVPFEPLVEKSRVFVASAGCK